MDPEPSAPEVDEVAADHVRELAHGESQGNVEGVSQLPQNDGSFAFVVASVQRGSVPASAQSAHRGLRCAALPTLLRSMTP